MNQYDFSVELKSTGQAEALKDLELVKKQQKAEQFHQNTHLTKKSNLYLSH